MPLRKSSPMNDSIDDPVPDSAKLIKMEAATRSSVQFKPSKRMKKRRQLDALVANDKKLSRRKSSAHELLRSNNDSGSSEVEDFGILHGHKVDKSWTSSGCCFTCYTLTCALLVTSCLLACASLIWMHLQLKRDFNDLRDRLELVENRNSATPEEFQTLQTKVNSIDKRLNDIRTGDNGLQALNKSIVSMQAQISSLAAAQKQQQQNIQTTNSQDQNDVAKTVTDLGSEVQSTKADMTTVKESQKTLTTQLDDLSDRVTVLENPNGREGGSQPDTEGLQVQVTQINSTLSQSLAKALVDLNKQQTHIEALDQFMQGPHGLQEQVTSVQQLALTLNQSQHLLLEALETSDSDSELTQLQNQVNELQQELEKGLVLLLQIKSGNMTNADPDLSLPPPSESYFQELLKDHTDFVHFKNEMYQDISSLNASMATVNGTVDGLRKDVGDLSTRVGQTVANITDLTQAVEEVVSLVNSHQSANLTRKLPNASDKEEKVPQSNTTESSSQTGG